MLVVSQELLDDWRFCYEVAMPYIRREIQEALEKQVAQLDDLIMSGNTPAPEPPEKG